MLDAIEGRLAAADRTQLDRHLAGCEVCRELVATSIHATTTLIDPTDRPRLPRRSPPGGADKLLGSLVGEYVVEKLIGSGGMGIVYRGSHPLLGKPVAIKILRPELAADAVHMRRMLSEARAMSSIAHRSIVDVFGFGELPDGRQYMVMEFLQGQPLNRIIRSQAPMPSWKLLPLLDGILEALSASHAAGVIHRDLKPSNLYVVEQADGSRFVKLLDFGLAKRELDDQGHTRAGRLVLGTPGYMAPEQIRADPVSHVTDLYALGVIAYELATGKRPFVGADPLEVMRQQVESEPKPPSALVEGLSPELERLILSLMAKHPADRPQSAETVRHAIKQLISGEPSRRRTQDSMPALDRARRPGTRQRILAGAALAGVVLLAIGGGLWGVPRLIPEPGPTAHRPTTGMRPEASPGPAARPSAHGTPHEPSPGPAAQPSAPGTPPEPSRGPAAQPSGTGAVLEPSAALTPHPAGAGTRAVLKPSTAVGPMLRAGPSPARITQKGLLERTARLRKRLAKATPRGEDADPMTTMLIDNAERDARSARGEPELKRVEQTIAEIERKYFKR